MSHKRVVVKEGKKYGPYLYESYRDSSGKVKKRYLGKQVEQKNNFTWILVTLLIFIGLLIILYNTSLTGKAVLSLNDIRVDQDLLKGNMIFTLQQSEFIPAETQVIISYGESEYSYNLQQLIEEEEIEGNFFMDGTSLSGSGFGYGISQELQFPLVSFVLGIYEESEEEGKTYTIPVEPVEDNESPEEIPEEENQTESGQRSISGNVISNFFYSLTGKATLELIEEINGQVRANESFVYDLEEGKTAQIISSDEGVDLAIENNQVIITTEYFGDEIINFEIPLDDWSIPSEDGELNVKFVYNEIELVSETKSISLEKEPSEEINGEEEIPGEETIRTIFPENYQPQDAGVSCGSTSPCFGGTGVYYCYSIFEPAGGNGTFDECSDGYYSGCDTNNYVDNITLTDLSDTYFHTGDTIEVKCGLKNCDDEYGDSPSVYQISYYNGTGWNSTTPYSCGVEGNMTVSTNFTLQGTGTQYVRCSVASEFYYTPLYPACLEDTAPFDNDDMEFSVLGSTANINLIHPIDRIKIYNSDINFTYNVSASNDIDNCSLYINDVYNQTNDTITQDVNQTFPLTLEDNDYNWSVQCVDDTASVFESSTNDFRVVAGATITSCDSNSPCIGNSSIYKYMGYYENNTINDGTIDECSDGINDAPSRASVKPYVENITITDLNDSTFSIGDTIEIQCSVESYALSIGYPFGTNYSISYYNGSTWTLLDSGFLNTTEAYILNTTLVLDNNGTKVVRCSTCLNTTCTGTTCLDDTAGGVGFMDNDDVSFLVLENFGNITLIYPSNEEEVYSSEVNFTYNVTGVNEVDNCSLYINDIYNQTNDTITEEENQTFSLVLENGNYNWKIGCTDNESNTFYSSKYNFVVSEGETLVSCGQELLGDTLIANSISCSGNGLNIGADDITIDCNYETIEGIDYGINISNRDNITLKNCNLNNFTTSLYLNNTSNSVFIGNNISNSSKGIEIIDSPLNQFYNITLNSNPVTFNLVNYSGNFTITGFTGSLPSDKGRIISKVLNISNQSIDSWMYINISISDLSNITRIERYNGSEWEVVSGSGADDNYAYGNLTQFSLFAPLGDPLDVCYCVNKTDCEGKLNSPSECSEGIILSNNFFVNETGITVNSSASGKIIDCDNYNITGNYTGLEINISYGLNITNANNLTIKKCNFYNFTTGINFDNSSLNNVTNISISMINSSTGISIYNSNNSSFESVFILGVDNLTGINLDNSYSNHFNNNSVTLGNYSTGIGIENSSSNMFNYNYMGVFGYSTALDISSNSNSFTGNLIASEDYSTTVYLDNSSSNYFSSNTIRHRYTGIGLMSNDSDTDFIDTTFIGKNTGADSPVKLTSLDYHGEEIYDTKASFSINGMEDATESAYDPGGRYGITKYVQITSYDDYLEMDFTIDYTDVASGLPYYPSKPAGPLEMYKRDGLRWFTEDDYILSLTTYTIDVSTIFDSEFRSEVFAPVIDNRNESTTCSSCFECTDKFNTHKEVNLTTYLDSSGASCLNLTYKVSQARLNCDYNQIFGDLTANTTGINMTNVVDLNISKCDIGVFPIGINIENSDNNYLYNLSLGRGYDPDLEAMDIGINFVNSDNNIVNLSYINNFNRDYNVYANHPDGVGAMAYDETGIIFNNSKNNSLYTVEFERWIPDPYDYSWVTPDWFRMFYPTTIDVLSYNGNFSIKGVSVIKPADFSTCDPDILGNLPLSRYEQDNKFIEIKDISKSNESWMVLGMYNTNGYLYSDLVKANQTNWVAYSGLYPIGGGYKNITDFTTAEYESSKLVIYNVSNQSSNVSGIFKKGSEWWLLANNTVYRYNTIWNYSGENHSLVSENNNTQAISWNGSDWWILANNSVYQYNLTWNYTGINYSLSSEDNDTRDIFWNGSDWWVLGNKTVYLYNSSWGYTGENHTIDEDDDPVAIFNKNNGLEWWVLGNENDTAYLYNSSWNFLDSILLGQGFSSIDNESRDFFWDGSYWWVLGDTNDRVYQYNLNWIEYKEPQWTMTNASWFSLMNYYSCINATPTPSGGGGGGKKACFENWSCDDWEGNCKWNLNYSINSILTSGIAIFQGIQNRTCIDLNECGTEIDKPNETRACAGTPIDIKFVDWCGDKYMEIYDKFTNKIIARVKQNQLGFSQLRKVDISFVIGDFKEYCCYNGIQDYDEEGIDCGGLSCPICLTRSFFDWLFWLILLLWGIIFIFATARIIIDRDKILLALNSFRGKVQLVSYGKGVEETMFGQRSPSRIIYFSQGKKDGGILKFIKRVFKRPYSGSKATEAGIRFTKPELKKGSYLIKEISRYGEEKPKKHFSIIQKVKEFFTPRSKIKEIKLESYGAKTAKRLIEETREKLGGKGF